MLKVLCAPSRLYEQGPFPEKELVDAVMGLADLGRYCGPAGSSRWTVEELEDRRWPVSGAGVVHELVRRGI